MSYRSVAPSADTSSDDNSDAEDEVSWKRSRHIDSAPTSIESMFSNPLKGNGAANGSGDISSNASGIAKARPARKRNNIWGNVIEEEVLTKGLLTSAMNTFERTRGMESYDYTSKGRLEAEEEVKSMEACGEKGPIRDRLGKSGDTEVSMEDGSIDRQSPDQEQHPEAEEDYFEMKPSVKDRLEIKSNVHDRIGAPRDHQSSYRKRGSRDRLTEADLYSDVKKRLGRRQDCKNSHFRMGTTNYVELQADDSMEKIVNGLSVNLNEPKVALLARVVEFLGPEKALRLLHETEMVEETGGLMVLNGSRRRTPGGVFLFLMRNDPHIEKKTMNEIFKEDRKELQERHRKIRAAKRQKDGRVHISKPERPSVQPMEDSQAGQASQTGEQSMEQEPAKDSHQPSASSLSVVAGGLPASVAPTTDDNLDDIFATTPLEEGEALPETDTFGVRRDEPRARHPSVEDGQLSDEGAEAGAAEMQATHAAETRAEDAEGEPELEEGEIED